MSSKTLFFEDIPKTATITNKDTHANYPTGHTNSSEPFRHAQYRKGRYNQTVGNPFGDTYPGTPACPYHMPRNLKRYEEPRLNIRRKNAGDVIEAKDINNLIDKLRLYNYVWEAEANNIYGYSGVNGRANASVDISKLKYINATTVAGSEVSQPALTINDAKLSGATDIDIPTTPYFFCCSGSDIQNVRDQLNNAMATMTRTNISFGGMFPYGIAENLNGYTQADTNSTTKVLNAGQENTHPVKFVQNIDDLTGFKLMYLAGVKKNQYVTDTAGNVLAFHMGIPYICSHRTNNETNPPIKYYGFILYFENSIKSLIPPSSTKTETITSAATFGIGKYGTRNSSLSAVITGTTQTLDTTKPVYDSGGHTQEINFDLKKAFAQTIWFGAMPYSAVADEITAAGSSYPNQTLFFEKLAGNVYSLVCNSSGVSTWMTSTFTKPSSTGYTSPVADWMKAKLNALPFTNLHIPKQKLIGTECYREAPDGSWIRQSHIYMIDYIEVDFDFSSTAREVTAGDGIFRLDDNPMIYLRIVASKWSPVSFDYFTSKVIETRRKAGTITGSFTMLPFDYYEYDNSFMADPCAWMESNQSVFTQHNYNAPGGFLFPYNNFLHYGLISGYDENGIPIGDEIFFDETGNDHKYQYNYFTKVTTYGQGCWFYQTGQFCPDGSAPVGGYCTYTVTTTTNYSDIVKGENYLGMTLNEQDITYKKDKYYIGDGYYPVIKGSDFIEPRKVLYTYIKSLLVLAQSGINNGETDTVTTTEIQTFLNNQAAVGGSFNKDDPDTSLEGYHAYSTGIIKLDFYNTLVDTYKILINSCICNADCACNIVCSCNVNCGCNY